MTKKELKELAEQGKGTFNVRMCDLVLCSQENRVSGEFTCNSLIKILTSCMHTSDILLLGTITLICTRVSPFSLSIIYQYTIDILCAA